MNIVLMRSHILIKTVAYKLMHDDLKIYKLYLLPDGSTCSFQYIHYGLQIAKYNVPECCYYKQNIVINYFSA